MARALYNFTRDLRIADHAGLAAAASFGEIVPVLILDRLTMARVGASPRRAAFYCACVAALDAALRERGSALIVRRGEAAKVLPKLAKAVDATAAGWCASYDRAGVDADERIQSALEEHGLRALRTHDAPAIPPEETAAARPSTGDGYRAFVPYFDLWRTLEVASFEAPLLLAFAPATLESEPLPFPAEFDSNAEPPQGAGPDAARAKFLAFLETDALQYASALAVPADDRTSHLSADLSFGTIAARTIVRETRRRMTDPFLLAEERSSLRSFLRSLAMRDFFLQLSWFNPQSDALPLQEKMREFRFASKHAALEAWRAGETGYPLVDAGIRQLRQTGWMHPRVRAIAASFLCFDLGVDWRVGRAEWDRHLIEDDPAISTGNWQWVAGVGADMAQYPRIYNPRKQARSFDPNGTYVRRYVPELAHLPAASIAAPREPQAQIELPLFSNAGYPQPVVEHERAAREFLARYASFRGER